MILKLGNEQDIIQLVKDDERMMDILQPNLQSLSKKGNLDEKVEKGLEKIAWRMP